MDEREQILAEIRRVGHTIEPQPLTQQAFKREGRISLQKVRYHFGSWNEAVIAAGLKPNASGVHPGGYTSLDESDLMNAIGEVWAKERRRPTRDLMTSRGRYSIRPYQKRWGSFRKAVDLYQARFGEPILAPPASSAVSDLPDHNADKPKSAQVIVPTTYKPKPAANRPRILYGEPIDFRGLRYAPINEQGVVYLFGMVSRELGFLLESVRTDYPDCEGKRALDRSGSQWQHVRIEFEYRSKNFVEHGHDPDGCDLIVCWIHDWDDCPIEVLELKSAIALLPPR